MANKYLHIRILFQVHLPKRRKQILNLTILSEFTNFSKSPFSISAIKLNSKLQNSEQLKRINEVENEDMNLKLEAKKDQPLIDSHFECGEIDVSCRFFKLFSRA